MPYGAPDADRPPVGADAARRTLALALDAGLEFIDTAPAYGDAEALVGEIAGARDCRIATKLAIPPAGWEALDDGAVRAAVDASVRAQPPGAAARAARRAADPQRHPRAAGAGGADRAAARAAGRRGSSARSARASTARPPGWRRSRRSTSSRSRSARSTAARSERVLPAAAAAAAWRSSSARRCCAASSARPGGSWPAVASTRYTRPPMPSGPPRARAGSRCLRPPWPMRHRDVRGRVRPARPARRGRAARACSPGRGASTVVGEGWQRELAPELLDPSLWGSVRS